MNGKDILFVFLKSLFVFAPLYLCFQLGSQYYGDRFSGPYPTDPIMVRVGDDPSWKMINIDESGWDTQFPNPPSNYWWRVRIQIDSNLAERTPLGLAIRSYLASYEAYWDGHHIGSNGKVGYDRTSEKPGGIFKVFLLPEMLSQPGTHLLAVRASQHYSTGQIRKPFLLLSSYDRQSQWLIIFAAFMHILAGVFLVIGLYYGLIFFKSIKEWQFLIFALLSSLLFLWILAEYVRFYYAYPYSWHFVRIFTISWLSFSVSLLISAFFIFRYQPQLKWLLIFQLVFQVGFYYWKSDFDELNYYYINIALLISFLTLFRAVWHKEKYSEEGLLSIIPLFAASFFFYPIYYDQVLFIGFTIFIFINLYALSRYLGDQRVHLELVRSRANLLKVELLKKNIHPHFLMNTLTSLISWVEESPKTAVSFIEALAEEFESLSEISEKQVIEMSQEVDLCKSHLKVMQFRHEIPYQLHTEGILDEEKIPPAIFLTLLENGLTHNKIDTHNPTFYLNRKEINNTIQYYFHAPGLSLKNDHTSTPGTGLQYVKARLSSMYGDKWKLESGPDKEGWFTKITIENS